MWDNSYVEIKIVVLLATVLMICAYVIQDYVDGRLQQTNFYAAMSSIGKPFGLCNEGYQADCVVDGDTIRYRGHIIRAADYDIPEIGDPPCSSSWNPQHKAMLRLLEILDSGPIELKRVTDRDTDGYGRELRVVIVNGRTIGETLIAEHLAEPADRRTRFWCR